MIEIISSMCDSIESFLVDLEAYKDKRITDLLSTSTKMTEEVATDILFNLQTKSAYLINQYNLNPRTVTNIFEKVNLTDFNKKRIGREVLH